MAKTREIDEETEKALKENLRYDPETGLFWWTKPGRGRNLNNPAGGLASISYARINFGGRFYSLHRLAFIFMCESLPEFVDHANGVKDDNRWVNLRPACSATNKHNQGKHKNNTTGYKGVYEYRGKFMASIRCRGARHYLGYFDCPKEAHKAYCDAADKMHKEYKNYG